MLDTENFPDTFYESDRSAAKAHANYPLTQEYIERLEAIAKAGMELWKVTPHANRPLVASCANDLYDALATINFLDETL